MLCMMQPAAARPRPPPPVPACSLLAPGWPTRDSLRQAARAPCRRAACMACACAAATSMAAVPALLEVEPLRMAEGAVAGAPPAPGVYAVYDAAGTLQYVGLSRKVRHCGGRQRSSPFDSAQTGEGDALPLPQC